MKPSGSQNDVASKMQVVDFIKELDALLSTRCTRNTGEVILENSIRKRQLKAPDGAPQKTERIGKDEMNLCELPFALLSDRANGVNVLQFEIDRHHHGFGKIMNGKLTVTGDAVYGLPTAKDEEIYLGAMKLAHEHNAFNSPEVRFCRSALFDLMGWQKNDWAYARLIKGMHRLVGVRLHYQNTWRDNSNKQWRDQGAFGILDSFKFRDSRTAGSNASFEDSQSMFRWSSVLFESFNSGYLKGIDYGLVRELKPTARRLYRYLDKHFNPPMKCRVNLDLARLAYQHIGVSQNIKLNKVRSVYIQPAAEALVEAGYLKRFEFEQVRRGVASVVFEVATTKAKPKTGSLGTGSRGEQLVAALAKRGISIVKASSFVAQHADQDLRQAILALDEQIAKRVAIRSPDKWMAKALADGFRASAELQRAAKRPELKIFRAKRSAS